MSIASAWQEHEADSRGKRHECIADHRSKAQKAFELKEAAEQETAIANAKLEEEQRKNERLERELADIRASTVATINS